ncbi:MAG TPA: cytochrome ubiquinol oxidase subunit I, partial [Candidatus Limnocylindrales bacterium]
SFLDSFTFTKSYKGLTQFKAADLPPIQPTYQAYHWMIVIFGLLLLGSVWLWWLNRQGKLEGKPGLLKILLWFWLLPELGIQLGWAAAEIGRQPWIVQGLLRTKDAVSVVVPAYQIALTIAIFFVIYALLFVGWARVVLGLIKKGPQTAAAKV